MRHRGFEAGLTAELGHILTTIMPHMLKSMHIKQFPMEKQSYSICVIYSSLDYDVKAFNRTEQCIYIPYILGLSQKCTNVMV